MFFFKHRLKMTSLRIGKHRIVKNIASLRKVNIAHPYLNPNPWDHHDHYPDPGPDSDPDPNHELILTLILIIIMILIFITRFAS